MTFKKKELENSKNALKSIPEETHFTSLEDIEFIVHQNVFSPKEFFSTKWVAKVLEDVIEDGVDFLEIGTGSGLISCYLAEKKKNIKVFATDINKFAIQNTQENIRRLNLEHRVSATVSDVFDNVPMKKYDCIFWAMPFGFVEGNSNFSILERSVADPGYIAIDKYFSNIKKYLKDNGQGYFLWSTKLADNSRLKKILEKNSIEISEVATTSNIESNLEVDMILYKF